MNRTQKAPSGSATFGLVNVPTKGVYFDTNNNPAVGNASADTGFGLDSSGNPTVRISGTAVQKCIANQTPSVVTRHTSASLAITSGTGVKAAIANPWGAKAHIRRCWLELTTAQGGTSTVDIGVAADASTASDTFFDSLNLNGSLAVYDHMNDTDNGTSGIAKIQAISSSQYVTINVATGDANTAVFTLFIEWVLY